MLMTFKEMWDDLIEKKEVIVPLSMYSIMTEKLDMAGIEFKLVKYSLYDIKFVLK